MVPNDEDADAIADDSVEEVIRKAFQVGSPEVAFVNVVSERLASCVNNDLAIRGRNRRLTPDARRVRSSP
jgi:hypothetical protein